MVLRAVKDWVQPLQDLSTNQLWLMSIKRMYILITLYAGAYDHSSLPSTVSHATRRVKLEWRRKNAQL